MGAETFGSIPAYRWAYEVYLLRATHPMKSATMIETYAPKIVLQLPISDPNLLDPFVEACLRDGVKLIAVVGEEASRIEDIIDEIVVGDGSDPSRFITTTFHTDETVEEVLDFVRSWERGQKWAVRLVKI